MQQAHSATIWNVVAPLLTDTKLHRELHRFSVRIDSHLPLRLLLSKGLVTACHYTCLASLQLSSAIGFAAFLNFWRKP